MCVPHSAQAMQVLYTSGSTCGCITICCWAEPSLRKQQPSSEMLRLRYMQDHTNAIAVLRTCLNTAREAQAVTCQVGLLRESTKTMNSALAACQTMPHSLLHFLEPLCLRFGGAGGPSRTHRGAPHACPAHQERCFICMPVSQG